LVDLIRTRSWRAAEELIAQVDRRLASEAPRSRVEEYALTKQRVRKAISARSWRLRWTAVIVLLAIGAWVVQRQQGVVAVRELRLKYSELESQVAAFTTPSSPELIAARDAAQKSLSTLEASANLGLWWRLQDGRQQVGERFTALQRDLHLAEVSQARQRVEQAVADKDVAAAQAALESLKTLVARDADRAAITGELTAKVAGLQRDLHLAEVSQARQRVEQAVADKDVAAAQAALESLKTLVARDVDRAAITGELTAKVTVLQREVFVRSVRELLAQESPSPQELARVAESLRALGGEAALVEEVLVRFRAMAAGRVAAWADVLELEPKASVIADAEIRARISDTGLPWKVRDRKTGIELVLIPPGKYQRGTPVDDNVAYDDERPAHEVTISQAFYMGVTEVTQSEWSGVMGSNPSSFTGGRLPVERVSWEDIQPFLQKSSGLRLPTEGEWEYACRAGTTVSRYGELGDVAWYGDNSNGQTHDVGGKRANPFGLHDMLGNVNEWCSDWYGDYSSASQTDPQGPSTEGSRVLRGGSWTNYDWYCRASFRDSDAPALRFDDIGFRVARTP